MYTYIKTMFIFTSWHEKYVWCVMFNARTRSRSVLFTCGVCHLVDLLTIVIFQYFKNVMQFQPKLANIEDMIPGHNNVEKNLGKSMQNKNYASMNVFTQLHVRSTWGVQIPKCLWTKHLLEMLMLIVNKYLVAEMWLGLTEWIWEDVWFD